MNEKNQKTSDSTSVESEQVKMSPIIWVLGIIALIVGVGSGIVMSGATLIK